MNNKYTELDIVCNGCGNLMMCTGQWPVQYPKAEHGCKNIQQTSRYSCRTCRVPNSEYEKGIPVGIAILEGIE